MNHKEFYKKLAHLLYAVAAVDGKVSRKEAKAIYDIVSVDLAPLEKEYDSSGMNKAFYTHFEFVDLAKQKVLPEQALQDFIEFWESNSDQMDETTAECCFNALEKVANSYHGMNKKESVLIYRLAKRLGKFNQLLESF